MSIVEIVRSMGSAHLQKVRWKTPMKVVAQEGAHSMIECFVERVRKANPYMKKYITHFNESLHYSVIGATPLAMTQRFLPTGPVRLVSVGGISTPSLDFAKSNVAAARALISCSEGTVKLSC